MSLRNQPYLPLYIQDYLTDEKLNMCSPAAQGVYVRIMCILHKQPKYGMLIMKQKYKQNSSIIKDFACVLSKLITFEVQVIDDALTELIDEGVLTIDKEGNLFQKRMIDDGIKCEKKAAAGAIGGKNKQNSSKLESKIQANAEIENENEIIIENEFKEGVQGEKNLSDPIREKIGKWAYAGFNEYSHILPEEKKYELVRWLIHLKEKDKPPGASTIRELVGDFQSRSLEDIRDRVSNAIKNNSNGSLWSERKIEKQKFGAVPSSY